MIKAVIIDDEQHCINRLDSLIKADFSGIIENAGQFTSVAEALQKVPAIKPDVVFLDVEINGQTGFDFLKGLPEMDFEVIFTTGYDKYAVQAFKFSAVDYLLKPIDRQEFKDAVARLREIITNKQPNRKLDVLYHNLKTINGTAKKICLPNVHGFIVADITDVVYCSSKGTCTTFFMRDESEYTVTKPLKEFEDMLTDYNFFRVHNSHLVNLSYVKSYNKGKVGTVVMANGAQIDVSTRRKDEFLKRIAEI